MKKRAAEQARSRARRTALWAAGIGAAASLPLAAAGGGWLGAKIVTTSPKRKRRRPSLEAVFHSEESANAHFGIYQPLVALRGDQAFRRGTIGLAFDDFFVQVGEVIETAEDEVGRKVSLRFFHVIDGEIPTGTSSDRRQHDRRESPGRKRQDRRGRRDRRKTSIDPPWPHKGRVNWYAWPDDPQILARESRANLEFDVAHAPDGDIPAWVFTPQNDSVPLDTWMIAVHGRGSRRSEVFRLTNIALEAGMPVVVASYRTDRWTNEPAKTSTLGMSEWEDVEAAMAVAIRNGARRIVLAGCSMGGGIVAMVLRRSGMAALVSGVILDSPALNWQRILGHVIPTGPLAKALTPLIMQAARLRAALDWDALDHHTASSEFAHPILLFHGTNDRVVPVVSSDLLAAARPDLVTYARFDGAGHVRSWNLSPERYQREVTHFLRTSVRAGALADAFASGEVVPLPRRRRPRAS